MRSKEGAKLQPISKLVISVFIGLGIFVSPFIFPYGSFLPTWSHHDDSFFIRPGEIGTLSVTSPLGNPIKVMLVISEDNCVRFLLKDQSERTITDETLADGRHYFWVQSGYTFFFENVSTTSQTVYWIIWIYYYNIVFQFLGSIFSALSVVGFLLNNRG